MCWNPEVSFKTFFISLITSIIALKMNYWNNLEFLGFMSFSIMQLLEGFMWLNLNNDIIINILSIIGLCVIYSQPIFCIINQLKDHIKSNLLKIYLLIATPILIYYMLNGNNTVHVAKNGHLAWDWLPDNMSIILGYLFFCTIPFIIDFDIITMIKGFVFVISALLSYNIYKKYKTWGSMWCWFVNFFSLFILFDIIRKYYIDHKVIQ